MSASKPSSPPTRSIPRSQLILVASLLIIGVGAEILILLNYLQLSANINSSFTPAVNLLPRLSALQTEVLQLHAETSDVLQADLPEYALMAALRASVADRLNELRTTAAGNDKYNASFEAVIMIGKTIMANVSEPARIEAPNLRNRTKMPSPNKP
jgi:hypothetical protein